jgi:hypothetical protein
MSDKWRCDDIFKVYEKYEMLWNFESATEMRDIEEWKIHPMALQPISGLGLLYWGSITAAFYGVGLLAPRPTPNLEDQISVFMTPGDRVAQLYLRALGSSGVPLPVPTIVGPWREEWKITWGNQHWLG